MLGVSSEEPRIKLTSFQSRKKNVSGQAEDLSMTARAVKDPFAKAAHDQARTRA